MTTSEYENGLGATAYSEYKAKYPPSSNAEYNQALANCGSAIAKVSGESSFQWQFTVLETNIENAFCLPGGKVAVYSGIMKRMRNEAELAFVVGHEVGHAIARHGGEKLTRSTLISLGGLLVSFGVGDDAALIYGIGSSLGVQLPFSRHNESEADRIGLLLMARAGYDPRASVQFWTRFSKGAKSSTVGNLLSTHPCDEKRIANMNALMGEALAEYRKCKNKRGFGMTFTHGN
ncbi:MAG: M48 family metallopeptidase [Victivallales bacterium]|nr:M48 family metallopeptidase [Victivallales bacterium]